MPPTIRTSLFIPPPPLTGFVRTAGLAIEPTGEHEVGEIVAYEGVKLADVESGGVVLEAIGRLVERVMLEGGAARQRR